MGWLSVSPDKNQVGDRYDIVVERVTRSFIFYFLFICDKNPQHITRTTFDKIILQYFGQLRIPILFNSIYGNMEWMRFQ